MKWIKDDKQDTIQTNIGAITCRELPYVSDRAVTVLHSGLHYIPKRKFYGVSRQFIKREKNKKPQFRVVLVGFGEFRNNYVVVPNAVIPSLTKEDAVKINDYKRRGFLIVTERPSYDRVHYKEGSKEWSIAEEENSAHRTESLMEVVSTLTV